MSQSKSYLDKVWDILVEHAGAHEPLRENFLATADVESTREWRFQGGLGFGGKVGFQDGRASYVTCYKDDLSPERKRMIKITNKELHDLPSTL
jgi:hypothetical protein